MMEQDIVTRMIGRLKELDPEFPEDVARQLELSIRQECAGMRFYIPRYPPGYLRQEVRRLFTGNNITEICRRLKIRRETAYRLLK